MLAPPLAATVSSVMALGFTARETIPIVFFGFAICSVVITLTGKMGATYAVPSQSLFEAYSECMDLFQPFASGVCVSAWVIQR
jgi:cytosine/uracil/thiamine/allantoin permease